MSRAAPLASGRPTSAQAVQAVTRVREGRLDEALELAGLRVHRPIVCLTVAPTGPDPTVACVTGLPSREMAA
jgi:hypothetical protein